MKVLMVNNQLHVLGGSETYMFAVAEELTKRGNDVQFFGKQDPEKRHGNSFGLYARNSTTPFSVIKNRRNIRTFGKILDIFRPDIVHINLFYFVLTPGIIHEAKKRNIPIVHTVHDPKIVCPNHRLYIEKKEKACMDCLKNGFSSCYKNKCIKNSLVLSLLATYEAKHYEKIHAYDDIDKFIFPSNFMRGLHEQYGVGVKNSVTLTNFSRISSKSVNKGNNKDEKYVLYFGRLSVEKGMKVLLDVIKQTPNIHYKIAGDGDCFGYFKGVKNCELLGFISGDRLQTIIANASLCVFPSIWYENCPMSILESISLGTPVVGSNIGGIPELIDCGHNGFVFEAQNPVALKKEIERIYFDDELLFALKKNCRDSNAIYGVEKYVDKLEQIYMEVMNK